MTRKVRIILVRRGRPPRLPENASLADRVRAYVQYQTGLLPTPAELRALAKKLKQLQEEEQGKP